MNDLKDIFFELLASDEDQELSSRFSRYFQNKAKETGVAFVKGKEVPAESEIRPVVRLGNKASDSVNIYYHAILAAKEEEVLLDTLKAMANGKTDLSDDALSLLVDLPRQVDVKIFIAPLCQFCPDVVSLANKAAIASNKVIVRIIDGTLFPDLVRKYRITAAPTVIIQDDYVLVGSDAKKNLISWIHKVAFGQKDASYYKAVLKDGRAQELARRFVKAKEVPDAFLELLCDSEWPSRLGAMVVMESIFDLDRELVTSLLLRLVDMAEEARKKGEGAEDLIYLLGNVGDSSVINYLEQVFTKDQSLKEAAKEAINSIKDRDLKLSES